MVESPLLEIVETQPDIYRAAPSHRNLGRKLSGVPCQPGKPPCGFWAITSLPFSGKPADGVVQQL